MRKEREGDREISEASADRTLVEATLSGDSRALDILHRRYYTRLYRLALVRSHNPQDAEDVASETFVRAIRHLAAYRFQGDSLFPWLARIAANLMADQGRRSRGATFVSFHPGSVIEDVRALLDALPSEAPDPHQLAERSEVRTLIYAAIARLPTDQAEAILLRFGGDMPLKEIAVTLNKTEGAVKSLLHRALVNLRNALSAGETARAVFGEIEQESSVAMRRSEKTVHARIGAANETLAERGSHQYKIEVD